MRGNGVHIIVRTSGDFSVNIYYYYYYYYYHHHHHRYYYYYCTICMSLVTGLFFPVLPLNQRWSPPLTLQASHCSTFRIMCDVPSIAVFCSESIECFLGIVSKFFFKLLVTIPVAPMITGTIVHLRFHIRCISIHKLLYLTSFRFLLHNISVCGYCHIYQCACFLFFVIIIIITLVPSLCLYENSWPYL